MRKFRVFDIVFFGMLGFASYFTSIVLSHQLNQNNYYIQFTLLITFISIVRWGKVGILSLGIANIPGILIFNGTHQGYLIYSFIELLVLIGPAMIIEKISNYKILNNKLLSFLLLLSIYLFESIGASIYFNFFGEFSFMDSLKIISTSYIFQFTINYIVLLILENVSSLFFDLKAELERTERNGREYNIN